ncbi:hypothetical protein EDB92DRAFT_1796615 [Lactarius akahatsu]|uniref:Uncharacterized protein n=1 Tax=Lactarius akahatsu TaxID=416441 RepID=A0AAD4Q8W9_9AGAM|nr:hypothetical protein EDB92DRAFT_1796615 [Lactarius akahatsu]
MNSPDRHHSSRHHCDRDHRTHSHAQSPSPHQHGLPKKHHCSHSLQGSSSDQPEKHSRGNPRCIKHERSEFFPSGACLCGSICAICLGCHKHSCARCKGPKLWDGSTTCTRKNQQGKLVATNGYPICFNWQVPQGCSSSSHPDQHRCSRCGKCQSATYRGPLSHRGHKGDCRGGYKTILIKVKLITHLQRRI